MSTEIERRVGNLLGSSKGTDSVDNSPGTSSQRAKKLMSGVDSPKPDPVFEIDADKERLSVELKDRQEKMKVHNTIYLAAALRLMQEF